MMALSWSIRNLIKSDNYTLFKKFLKLFCLNKELRRSDMVAYVDVMKLIKANVSIPSIKQPVAITPAGYYSNCGVQDDEFSYFVHNIFNVGGGYSTYCSGDIADPLENGINIQAYLGQECKIDSNQYLSMTAHRKDPENNPLEVELPLEQFLTNKNEIESFKQLTSVKVDMQNNGCTCFCSVFMAFVCHREINCRKSKVLSAFAGINTLEKLD